ncbi:alpha/beta-Hydrolases superfamily protein [Zea mays]|uniref:Alpha/beta-Hydrolases superfamily protein n=1 Tax=Zea mays TaxID=4577 RepID=A0A1D6J713_MAIZE|nr:alpha/beta-Hydrolases superfamily protein [Zea mays]
MLLLHLQNRDLWRYRAMLNDTMCGVNSRIKPPWPLEHLLAAVVPTWHVAFTRGNILESFFKVDWKLALMLASSRRTTAPPRAATVLERLRICCELQHRFEEVQLSFLGVHGVEDTVCNPACVEELCRHAGSKDKTLCVYLGNRDVAPDCRRARGERGEGVRRNDRLAQGTGHHLHRYSHGRAPRRAVVWARLLRACVPWPGPILAFNHVWSIHHHKFYPRFLPATMEYSSTDATINLCCLLIKEFVFASVL